MIERDLRMLSRMSTIWDSEWHSSPSGLFDRVEMALIGMPGLVPNALVECEQRSDFSE
jgi:hypothetical protein